MKRKILLFVSIIMVATLVLAGCGDGDTSGDNSGSGQAKDSVKIPLDSIGNTMDVHASTLRVDSIVTRQFSEGLYYVEDDGTLAPRLAENYEVSEDGTVYTFELREGVKFHNGEEFTASDVVWNFQRCLDEMHRYQYVQDIVNIEALNDYTVEFTIEAPSSVFVYNIANVLLVSQVAVEEAGDEYGAIVDNAGTGPYILTKYDMNQQILLEANPEYWRGQADIENIEFVPMADASTKLIAFERGEFDFVEVPTADWNNLVDSGKFTTETAPGLHISYLGLNVGKEDSPLYDEKVRQAIAYALDKESMVAVAADGLADVADYMMRPDLIAGSVEHGNTYSYDPEKARELLADAGYADGFDLGAIEAINAANNRYVKIAEILEQNLADIGITSTIKIGETASMLPAWKTDREYDIFVSGFTPSITYFEYKGYVYSEMDLQVQLNLNENIDTDLVDDGFDEATREQDEDRRDEIYGEVDSYLMDMAAYIPVMNVNTLFAWDEDLSAVAPIRYYDIYAWSWE